MREEILNNLSEDEIEFLQILSYRLNNQNQRCTAYPVWKVCDIERKYNVAKENADGYCILNNKTGEVYLDCDQIIEKIIQEKYDQVEETSFNDVKLMYGEQGKVNVDSLYSIFEFIVNVLKWEGYSYCNYIEIMKVYASFITEDGAENYMRDNKYKYSEDAYIYVDSGYGNFELMTLIDILKKLKN